ncbi:isochorismatase family protein [Candidatus Saccharibacteria bacterium]|nr:isochorismatase family protein [Calditrichia bacterium]NIW00008.1 isochorismatase family protein [Candidatus Saccharibacteria bacterium]
MRIPKDDSVAVVVDVQERMFPHIRDKERIAQNMVKMIKGLQILEVPILVTQQYTKGLGETIPEIAEALGDFTPLEKLAFSCIGDSDFTERLIDLKKNRVILMGVEAHVCILQTALDLLTKAFRPIVVEDCVSSRKLNDMQIAVERMRNEGTIITTCESILLELCVVAGTDQFKAISRLIK